MPSEMFRTVGNRLSGAFAIVLLAALSLVVLGQPGRADAVTAKPLFYFVGLWDDTHKSWCGHRSECDLYNVHVQHRRASDRIHFVKICPEGKDCKRAVFRDFNRFLNQELWTAAFGRNTGARMTTYRACNDAGCTKIAAQPPTFP